MESISFNDHFYNPSNESNYIGDFTAISSGYSNDSVYSTSSGFSEDVEIKNPYYKYFSFSSTSSSIDSSASSCQNVSQFLSSEISKYSTTTT